MGTCIEQSTKEKYQKMSYFGELTGLENMGF